MDWHGIVDVMTPAQRSRMMASVRGEHTLPELRVRSFLHACGLRYRLHVSGLPGRPDLVLPKYRTAVFVHGCFWHRHDGCRFAAMPSTRVDFWQRKFEANRERDRRVREMLEHSGWRVIVIWECETRDVEALDFLFWSIVSGEDGKTTQESAAPP